MTIEGFDIEQEIRFETRKALDRGAAEPFLQAQIEKLEAENTSLRKALEKRLCEDCNARLNDEYERGCKLDDPRHTPYSQQRGTK